MWGNRLSMKNLQLIGGVVLLFITLSCTSNQEIYKSDIPEGTINMRINVQKRISDNLLFEIIELNDNRCPIGSICNNAGYVQVELRVIAEEVVSTKSLFFSDYDTSLQNTDTIAGLLVELLKVTPYPYANKPLEDPENYTVSLIVEEL